MDNQLHQGQLNKPLDGQEIYRKNLAHLIWMAGLKGAKQYAWQRAKQLESNPSGVWHGITNDLTKAMNEKSGKD